MSVVGIDVGNLNAVIAAARQGGIEVLTNEYTYRLTPSMVSIGQKERFIGEAARPQQTTNFKNTITQFKRLIGRKYADPEVQEELRTAVFTHEALSDGGIGIKVNFKGTETVFTPEQIYGMFMSHLKSTAENNLHKPVVDVVVSCPNWFNDFQRRAVENSCRFAGLNCVRILNDTTATALAYGIYRPDLPETEPRHVAFVDIGHSSLQVAVVAFVKGKLTVKATSSDRTVGGRDLDNVLYEHFRKEFLEKNKVDLNERPRSRIRLLTECEKLKKLMSANNSSLPINIECLTDEHDFRSHLSREEFETLADGIFQRIQPTIAKCITESGVTIDAIDSVEIVGGSSRVPKFKDIIAQIFGKEPSTTLNADEVVARGCALQAAIVSPTFRVREMKIEDACPYSMDLLWTGADGNANRQNIFEQHSVVPSTKMLTFKRTEPFELTLSYTNPQDVPGSPEVIGRFRIGGVQPDANGEGMKIKIRIKCNGSGMVGVESAIAQEDVPVEAMETDPAPAAAPTENGEAPPPAGADMDTDKAAETAEAEAAKPKKQVKKIQLPVDALDELTSAEVNKYQELEMQMALEDRLEHERVDVKNNLEEFVYETRDKLDGAYSEYVSEQAREELSSKLTSTEDWLYDEGEDESKKVYAGKLDDLRALVTPIQARAKEWQELPAAEEALRTCIVRFRKVTDLAKTKDERYAHISEEEISKVDTECNSVEEWLNAETAKNAQRSKADDVQVTCAAINDARANLERACNPIVLKPKPKPATPPPATAGTPVPEATPAPTAEAEEQKPAEQAMDVD